MRSLRKTPIKRSQKPIKKRPRSKAEKLRIYGPPGYVEWMHQQPCIACGVVGYSEVAHIQTGGMGRKDDWTRTVPLCGQGGRDDVAACHPGLHYTGRSPFETFWKIDLDVCASSTHQAWMEYSGLTQGTPK